MSSHVPSLDDFREIQVGDIIEVHHAVTGRLPAQGKNLTRMYLILDVRVSALTTGGLIMTCLTAEGVKRQLRMSVDDVYDGRIRLISRMSR